MKEFFEIMMKDIQKDDFTQKDYLVYGIIAPIALIALMCLGGWLEGL